MMIPLLYSPRYNVTAFGLEKLHPFDASKYRRIHDWLMRQGLRKGNDFIAPRPVTREELLRVHSEDYLRSLSDRKVLARILEVPWIGKLPAFLTKTQARDRGIPLAMVLSGGYGPLSWKAHAQSIEGILARFDK